MPASLWLVGLPPLRMHPQGAYVKPPPYCSSLQDGGGFLRLEGRCAGCACRVWSALAGFGVRSLGSAVFEASPEPVVTAEASPDNAGGVWRQQLRLHRTTQAGECPLCGAGRLEDGAPALRARYAPPSVLATRLERMRSPRVSGMRLWTYLRYALVCTYMNGTLPKWTNSEPGCVLYGFMLG